MDLGKRWTARRKAEVLEAIGDRRITIAKACAENGISIEELGRWYGLHSTYGLNGLRVGTVQTYREIEKKTRK